MKNAFSSIAIVLAVFFSGAANAALITYDIDIVVWEAPQGGPNEPSEPSYGVGEFTVDTELFAFTKVDISSGYFSIDWAGVAPVAGESHPVSDEILSGLFKAQTGLLSWTIRQDYYVGTNVLASLAARNSGFIGAIELYYSQSPDYIADGYVSEPRVVSEPSVFALLGLGLLGLGLKRRLS